MEGYVQKLSRGKLKRYVQFLEISEDPELVAQYRKWHSEEYNWKEVRDGIREVGILEMEIYILGSKLVGKGCMHAGEDDAPAQGRAYDRALWQLLGQRCIVWHKHIGVERLAHLPGIVNTGEGVAVMSFYMDETGILERYRVDANGIVSRMPVSTRTERQQQGEPLLCRGRHRR